MFKNHFGVNGAGTGGPNTNQKIGFLPSDKEVVATRGVKLKTKASVQQEQEAQERAEYQAKFSENAERTIKYHDDKSKNAVSVISKFMKLIDDKTLPVNIGTIAKSVEKEIRKEIIDLAIEMNNDENEENNGMGSIVLLSAMSKVLLMYRDRLNELEFKLEQLEREQKKLSSQVQQQNSNATK